MTSGRALRIALLAHRREAGAGPPEPVARLHAALRDAGHEAVLVEAPGLPEELLRRRGFTGPLTPVPGTVLLLRRGRFDVAHAFTPPDALAARLWRRRSRGIVAFTVLEELRREHLADERLRLGLLAGAVERSDVVVAPDARTRASVRRWMAAEAEVGTPADAAGHERLYRAALGRRAQIW